MSYDLSKKKRKTGKRRRNHDRQNGGSAHFSKLAFAVRSARLKERKKWQSIRAA